MIRKYAEIFCWKNMSSFCNAKATHIFSAKNISILCIESAKTVNEMTLNELVKLTTLWTTGPWPFDLSFHCWYYSFGNLVYFSAIFTSRTTFVLISCLLSCTSSPKEKSEKNKIIKNVPVGENYFLLEYLPFQKKQQDKTFLTELPLPKMYLFPLIMAQLCL